MADDSNQADAGRFALAIRRFDEENARDPNMVEEAGQARPRELVYAQWLADWVVRLCPNASEALRLAARCQHLCRWKIPRNSYPMTRAGYLHWREALKKFHAEKSAEILRGVGYPDGIIARVQELNLKKGLPQNLETQVLEDALCLVFLERQLADLAHKTTEDKVVNALKKAWVKMSPAARVLAQEIPYGANEKRLLDQALTST